MKLPGVAKLWFPPMTFYQSDGTIDFKRMEKHLKRIYPYSRSVLVPGSAGDGWILPDDVQKEIVRRFLKGFSFGDYELMIGTLKPTADRTINAITRWINILKELTGVEDASEAMAIKEVEAFMICVPQGVADPKDQERELSKILDLGVRMAFYQLPQMTGVTVSAETLKKLTDKYPNLIFGKDSDEENALVASGIFQDRLMLFQGAEGDPTKLVLGEKPVYDALMLATVNCFPSIYADILDGKGGYERIASIIEGTFEAAKIEPVSNIFSDAIRAIDHVIYYGRFAPSVECYCIYGAQLPKKLIERCADLFEEAGMMPEKGYKYNPEMHY